MERMVKLCRRAAIVIIVAVTIAIVSSFFDGTVQVVLWFISMAVWFVGTIMAIEVISL